MENKKCKPNKNTNSNIKQEIKESYKQGIEYYENVEEHQDTKRPN